MNHNVLLMVGWSVCLKFLKRQGSYASNNLIGDLVSMLIMCCFSILEDYEYYEVETEEKEVLSQEVYDARGVQEGDICRVISPNFSATPKILGAKLGRFKKKSKCMDNLAQPIFSQKFITYLETLCTPLHCVCVYT